MKLSDSKVKKRNNEMYKELSLNLGLSTANPVYLRVILDNYNDSSSTGLPGKLMLRFFYTL